MDQRGHHVLGVPAVSQGTGGRLEAVLEAGDGVSTKTGVPEGFDRREDAVWQALGELDLGCLDDRVVLSGAVLHAGEGGACHGPTLARYTFRA